MNTLLVSRPNPAHAYFFRIFRSCAIRRFAAALPFFREPEDFEDADARRFDDRELLLRRVVRDEARERERCDPFEDLPAKTLKVF